MRTFDAAAVGDWHVSQALRFIQGQATINQFNWPAHGHVVPRLELIWQDRDLGGIPCQAGVVKACPGDIVVRKALFLPSASSCSYDNHLLIANTFGCF